MQCPADPLSGSMIEMNMRFLFYCISMLCLSFIFTGCKEKLGDFEFVYTVENVSNFKTSFTLDSDGSYRIEKFNYYMDNMEGKARPVIENGTLTAEQLAGMRVLLEKARLSDMKDQYGFEDGTSDEDGFFTQLALSSGGKTKYITIRNIKSQKFPQSFLDLVRKVMTFI